MNSIYKISSNRGLVGTFECLPLPKIAVFTKSGLREGFNQEDGFETVSVSSFLILYQDRSINVVS